VIDQYADKADLLRKEEEEKIKNATKKAKAKMNQTNTTSSLSSKT
jgi:hypothetical protein